MTFHLRAARIAFLSLIAICCLVPATASAQSGRYIVVLKPGFSGSAAAHRHGAAPSHVYSHALRGYAAYLSDAAYQRAEADGAVDYIAVDRVVRMLGKTTKPPTVVPPQETPTGIQRINAAVSRTNGGDDATDVDVAVIDTGIDMKHPDLVYAGGVSCIGGPSPADGNGHGTHVAGTIGAKDNNLGVVGVAPGARLWAVRVLNSAGSGSTASVMCGIDWVTARAATIEVANLSLGGPGTDDGNCGASNNDPMHAAICRSVTAGVTYAVAAGNETADASLSTPAAYDEVITVSAYADFDGIPGALGSSTCRTDQDDSFASFSNFGLDVDISAPGVCITSTWRGGAYNTISGTSMASPHVAGAAALYKSQNPTASPAGVAAALILNADTAAIADDPVAPWEGLLNIGGWL